MIKNILCKIFISVISLSIFITIVTACSIDVNQNMAFTPTITNPPSLAIATFTVPPPVNDPTPALPAFSIPITWANLNLTGRLVYVIVDPQTNAGSIKALDLANGVITTIFQAPENSWIYFSEISPDYKQLVISYSEPSSNNSGSKPALYLLSMDGSTPPSRLFNPPSDLDEYYQPSWSPDGKYIYYFHLTLTPLTSKGQQVASVDVERVIYPDGQPEKIVNSAFWPRVSNDSNHLVYVSNNPTDGKNKLFLSNLDGSGAQEVAISGTTPPDIIDAPLLSPDGQSILFSAIVPTPAPSSTWLEKLMGVTVASAHSVPSEWWSVPAAGGAPKQLTHIQTTGLYANYSPDGKFIVSSSGMGLFVMQPDGSDLTMIIDGSYGYFATVSWIP